MFWEKIGNSVLDRLFRVSVRDSVIAENQCLYVAPAVHNNKKKKKKKEKEEKEEEEEKKEKKKNDDDNLLFDRYHASLPKLFAKF